MLRYCYVVVEGQHDLEFLVQLLKTDVDGLKRVTQLPELDPFWHPLVPRTFPINDDLLKRVPVPIFLQSNELSIALHCASGDTRLADTVEESLALLSPSQLFSVGLVLDADSAKTPSERFKDLAPRLCQIGITLPPKPGEVSKNSPRSGIFVIPDNTSPGTLENILIECAQQNYPDLHSLSNSLVTNIDTSKLKKDDLKELMKPAGRNKAIVSSISSVLKPGKALQVSLQDNRWIDEQTIGLASIKRIIDFLSDIIGIT